MAEAAINAVAAQEEEGEEGGDMEEEEGVSRRLEAESLAEQEMEQRQAVDASAAALRKLDAALHRAATRAEAAALEAKAAVEADGVARGQVRRTARALEEAEEEARQVASEVPSRMDSIRGASEARMPDVVARWLEVDDDAEPMEEEEEGWAEEEGEESADGPVPMEDAETSDDGAEALVSRLRDGELQLEVTRRRRQELVRKHGTAESLQAFLDAAGASEGGVGLLEQLQILQIKAETVTSSIASLRAGIGQMEGKVSAANAETVRAVAARTGELFEVLVPQLEVEIACADPGRLGESSARFRFRSRERRRRRRRRRTATRARGGRASTSSPAASGRYSTCASSSPSPSTAPRWSFFSTRSTPPSTRRTPPRSPPSSSASPRRARSSPSRTGRSSRRWRTTASSSRAGANTPSCCRPSGLGRVHSVFVSQYVDVPLCIPVQQYLNPQRHPYLNLCHASKDSGHSMHSRLTAWINLNPCLIHPQNHRSPSPTLCL